MAVAIGLANCPLSLWPALGGQSRENEQCEHVLGICGEENETLNNPWRKGTRRPTLKNCSTTLGRKRVCTPSSRCKALLFAYVTRIFMQILHFTDFFWPATIPSAAQLHPVPRPFFFASNFCHPHNVLHSEWICLSSSNKFSEWHTCQKERLVALSRF